MKKSGDENIFVDDGEAWEEEDGVTEEKEKDVEMFLGDDEEEEY